MDFKTLILTGAGCMAILLLPSCTSDDNLMSTIDYDAKYVGTDIGNFSADEWYPGGKLGTTENIYAGGYEMQTPAIDQQGLTDRFMAGDLFASNNFTLNSPPYKGWGPVASRRACQDCHSGGYGHAGRRSDFSPVMGNGYIVSVYYPESPGSNDGTPIEHLNTFTMCMAVKPFLPPVDPEKIQIKWNSVTAMESGLPMHFPDGETFELIYPEVEIPQDAFNVYPLPSGYAVRLIVSCNFQGLGLIDALDNIDIEDQYRAEAPFVQLNPEFWNGTSLTDEAYVDLNGRKFIKRFNYDLLGGSLEEDVALWDELNILRSDIPHICSTQQWADAMAMNQEVIGYIKTYGASPDSYLYPYYYDGTEEGISEAIAYLLSPDESVNLYDNKYYNFKPEISDDDYYSFIVWHRGIAVPRARDLNDKDVQRGKEVFTQIGCASCHRPKWTTGKDNPYKPEIIRGKDLPTYSNQTIYPYSDFIQHKLSMKNDIHGSWCRTTPLWGRGLATVNGGTADRLHDCRARNEIEAIMWHAYSQSSHAYESAFKFYSLPKKDRDAVVKFLRSI